MSMPLPPKSETKETEGTLTENETDMILRTVLTSKNRSDKTTLQFIDAFIRCKSIKQASHECGIHPTLGYKIRHSKDVANAISRLIDKSAVKHGIDGSEIFERVKEVVDFDPIELMNQDGTFKSNLHDIAPEARRVLKKLKVKNIYNNVEDINGMKQKLIVGEVIEYEFYDKLKASELVGSEKNMFKKTTKVEHTVSKDMASILLASKSRGDRASEAIDITPVRKEIGE